MASKKQAAPKAPPADAGTQLIEQFDMAQDVPEEQTDILTKRSEEAPVETVSEPVVEKPKHSKWITNQAKRVGIEADELAEMSREEVLEAISLSTEREREFRAAERPRDDSGRFTKPEPPAPEPEKEFDLKDYGIDLGEDANEFTRDAFKKALSPFAKKIKELESQLSETKQREAHREANAHADRLDQLFLENTDVFGKGTRHRMDKKSDAYSLRMMVIGEMQRISQSEPGISFDDAFDRASSVIKKFAAPKAETPAPEPEPKPAATNGVHREEVINRFKNGTTAAPANRSTAKPPKGVKAAEASVAALLTQMNDELDDELAGLPGGDD